MNQYQKTAQEILQNLCSEGKIRAEDFDFEPAFPLARLTSFHIGGPACVVFPHSSASAQVIFPALSRADVKLFLLGSGTNVLARDEGYDGVIFSLSRLTGASVSGNRIEAEAGFGVTGLASLAQKNSLTGLEFAYGIPGSVGGGVFMNGGAYGGEMSDVVESVLAAFPDGSVCRIPAQEIGFGYRQSVFQENGALILSAVFNLKKGDPEAIRARMAELMQRRRDKQPLEFPSAGSTFKRCDGHFTAQVIDSLGLKGKRVGGAMVSEKHAGFIINFDHATGCDVMNLIREVQKEVREKAGLAIEPEIRVIE